ncbi:MAG: nitronate monooxygenase [Bacteroidota bacterium]|nr:nitronate monooxygenase [Bacteroidota bacterium]
MKNRITELFGIRYPIIQGGMIWCSDHELVSAVSNAGGLGLLGAGSMYPDILREQIRQTKAATDKPFGVNLPLLYPDIEAQVKILLEEGVKIVFTSAGNPKTLTDYLQERGVTVAHVTANSKFALKAEASGVDAIVAEGFEAGGHNGREETTTMSLIPVVKKKIKTPLIAAGGIGSGEAMLSAMALGADGVQVGSRFAASLESSAHDNFKKEIINAKEGDTQLLFKKLIPVRLIRNEFALLVHEAEKAGKSRQDLQELLGKGRAKQGMFEGDSLNGELEIGQVSSSIDRILSAQEIIDNMIREYADAKERMTGEEFKF